MSDPATPPAGTPPAGTPPAGTPPAGTPPAGTPPAGTPPAAPWHGYTTPEDVAYVANKAWQGPQDAIRSYREAEKLIGRDPSTLLVMPRADDPQGFLSVMDKLGRPPSPDKYEFDLPQGADPKNPFLEWARGTFHKLGLPANVAKALVKEFDGYQAQTAEQFGKDYQTSVAADKTALQNEWRGGYERMMGMAQNAAKSLGFTAEMIDAMEAQIGYAATMKHFAELGKKMGEDSFVGGGEGGNGPRFEGSMTPEEAQQAWAAKKMDANYMAALRDKSHPGHKEAQAMQTKLFAIMYPG